MRSIAAIKIHFQSDSGRFTFTITFSINRFAVVMSSFLHPQMRSFNPWLAAMASIRSNPSRRRSVGNEVPLPAPPRIGDRCVSLNGSRTVGMIIIMAHQKMALHGLRVVIVINGFCVADHGLSNPNFCDPPEEVKILRPRVCLLSVFESQES